MKLDEDDVKNVLTNPIYTGIPPFPTPGIVSDEEFIAAGKIMVEKEGFEAYMRLLLTNLRNSMVAAQEATSAGHPPPSYSPRR